MAFPDDPIGAGDWSPGFVSAATMQTKVTDRFDAIQGRLPVIDTGEVTITPVANTPTSSTVTFGLTFDSAPIVMVTFHGSAAAVTNVSYTNVTTTTVDIVVTRTNTTSTTVSWFAVLVP